MVTVPEPVRRTTSLPVTVVVAAVLAFVDAVLLLLGLANLLLVVGRLSLTRPGSLSSSTLAGLLGAAVLVPLVLAAAGVVAGIGVLQGRRAARVALTVVAAFLVLQGGLGIAGATGGATSLSPVVLVTVVVSAAVLVLLWVPASRAWFARSPR